MPDEAIESIDQNVDWGDPHQVNAVTASGGAQTIPDPSSGPGVSDITLTAACTVTLPTPVKGHRFRIYLRQDATGSRIVTWAGGTRSWAGGTAPTLSTAPNAIDRVDFESPDGTIWYGSTALGGTLADPNAITTVATSGGAQSVGPQGVWDITLTAACTVTVASPVKGDRTTLYLRQDATGSRVVTWAGGTIKWSGAAAPTLTTTAHAVDKVVLDSPDGTTWFANAILDFA